MTDTETFNTIIGSNVKYRYLIYIQYWYTGLSVIHLIKISLSYIYLNLQEKDDEDWLIVNRKLKENGLKAIKIQHPSEVENLRGKLYTFTIVTLIQYYLL